ncbi:MAG: hypothetical protein ACXWXD_04240 [Candidatus Deferrimicrobiaceae bacterium]
MTGKLLSFLGVVVVLAGAYLVALDLARSMRLTPGGDGGTADIGGPKIVLRGVEMIEAREEGPAYRLRSDDASYSAMSARVVASGVTLTLKERKGDIVVTAPAASWDMNEGRVDLDEGASARNDRGWTASAPRAVIDLRSEEIAAEEASLAAPGVTVTGSNLRWRWREGTMALDSPRSRIIPRTMLAPGKRG